jgi:2-polyprenyl-6-methoxyphenol hydroxylase-like FAD-dependent oxidoreductase
VFFHWGAGTVHPIISVSRSAIATLRPSIAGTIGGRQCRHHPNERRSALRVRRCPPNRFRDEVRPTLQAGYGRALAEVSPALAAAVAASRLEGRLWAFAGRRGFLREAWGPGWALVGDAGYFKDPLTAHGMTDALRDAELLAVAAARGSEIAFAAYAALREELSRAFFDATDAIASFAWNLDTVRRLHLELNTAKLISLILTCLI